MRHEGVRPRGVSTKAVHSCEEVPEVLADVVPPLHVSVVYRQEGPALLSDRGLELKYGREENPTARRLERMLASLENGFDALAFNSGMAAISTLLLGLLDPGGKVVTTYELYGGTYELFQALARKVNLRLVLSLPDTENVAEAVRRERPDLVFVETITNPTLRVIDLRELASLCADQGCMLVVDNTFATPILVRPLDHGAFAVVHSLTKYIAGHNDVIGGGLVLRDSEFLGLLWNYRRMLGTIIQPWDSYLCIRGAKTLVPRFERSSQSALVVAEYLVEHPRISRVLYPGLGASPYRDVADRLFSRRMYGAVLSFEVKGGMDEAVKVLRRVRVIKPSPSLGATESLLSYPILSAAKGLPGDVRKLLGITEGLLRLSVGLEDVEDILEDLSQALS